MESSINQSESGMSVDALYNYILGHMTAEEALYKLLSIAAINYTHLKFADGTLPIYPEIVIFMAAQERGWQLALSKDDEIIQGMIVGTAEFIQKIIISDTTNA